MGKDIARHVFISYAREDIDVARRLYRDLATIGDNPWLDVEHLLGGQHWKAAISSALRHASHFIALMSRHSITKKGYVQRELRDALSLLDEHPPDSIFLIPVRLDDAEPQHERLRELNWIQLLPDYDVGFRKICASLGRSHNISLDTPSSFRQVSEIRIQAGAVDVVSAVHHVVNLIRPDAERNKIDLRIFQECREAWVAVPVTELREAIRELVENAIKFTSPVLPTSRIKSAWVNISITATDRQAQLTVENWGTAVAPDEHELVFEYGYRGRRARTAAEGNGAGLFFLKKFAARYRGDVSVWSDPAFSSADLAEGITLVSLAIPLVSAGGLTHIESTPFL